MPNKEFSVFSREIYFIKAIENFFSCVCIAWYKHEWGWENSRQLCKPVTWSRVCITVKNSPNPWSVYVRICKHRKNVFYCFCKIPFPRKKAKLSCLERWLKEKFLPVAKSCTRSLYVQSVFVLRKRCFPKYGFFSLKMSAQVKKNWHSFNRQGSG